MPSSQTILEKFVNITKQEPFRFQVSPVDPCMLFEENGLGVCIIINEENDDDTEDREWMEWMALKQG